MPGAKRRLALLCLLLAGCAGPVVPQRSPQIQAQDTDLGRTVTAAIRVLDATAFRTVTATAWEGRVLLTGAVVKPEQRQRAEHAAAALTGPDQLQDEIQLTEADGLERFLPDSPREHALKARLTANYDVRVVNGVAYLLGHAATAQDAEAAKETLLAEPGVKWVVPALIPIPGLQAP